MATWTDIITLSVVEGITEFLPVSSTGHMILVREILKMEESKQLDAFLVIVQAGAILAVTTIFLQQFLQWSRSWLVILKNQPANAKIKSNVHQSLAFGLSVIPFAVIGYMNKDFVKSLFSFDVVAYALITGGIFMLVGEYFCNKATKKRVVEKNLQDFGYRDAFFVGMGQCLALWPGFSRSAATIIVSRFTGFSRKGAAEVSFLVGMPTLLGAAGYETLKAYKDLNAEWIQFLVVGILVAWVTAYFCVKGFVAYLRKYSLSAFAYYRISVGILILLFMG